MNKNTNLHKAKSAKNDEFYTQMSDIELELSYYKPFFKGKTVYCNCDMYDKSNFFRYFGQSFEHLGLKKLIATGYVKGGHGIKAIYEGDKNGNLNMDDAEILVSELKGDGSYDSAECIELLDEADVVVTNPPFSLFREYVKTLNDHHKSFLIIGPMNCVTYKEIFPMIKNNTMWVGMNARGGTRKGNSLSFSTIGGAICDISSWWFTNIENNKRNLELTLYKKYNPIDYPKYDNYDAIEVYKTNEIPMDYDGVMGVPISFLDKYCPKQFEIVGAYNYSKDNDGHPWNAKVNGNYVYKRILIRRK